MHVLERPKVVFRLAVGTLERIRGIFKEFHDALSSEDQDVRSEHHGLRDVVRHEKHRAAVAAAQFDHPILQTLAKERVQSRKGLVHEKNVGRGNERAPERKTLTLSARERLGEAPLEPREFELLEHGPPLFLDLGARGLPENERKREVFPDALPGEQRQPLPDETRLHLGERHGAPVALPGDFALQGGGEARHGGKVLFPQPDGPTTASDAPAGSVRSSPRRIGRAFS